MKKQTKNKQEQPKDIVLKECVDCGRILREGITTSDINSIHCDNCYYFD